MNNTTSLIVFEGIDGSGKTTQAEMLKDALREQGRSVELISFPQYKTAGAKMVEEYLMGNLGGIDDVSAEQASVFYAIDRYANAQRIKELLKQNIIVIIDRYISSNLAHQGSKIPDRQLREQFFSWILDLEYNKFKIPKPTLQFFLDVAPQTAFSLIVNDKQRLIKDIHERDYRHLENSYLIYKEIFGDSNDSNMVTIQTEQGGVVHPKEHIHQQILSAVKRYV